jgi:hypothetical protein
MRNEFAVQIATRAKERVAKIKNILVAIETISSLPPTPDHDTAGQLDRLADEIIAELDRFQHDLHPEWQLHAATLN